MVGCEEWTVPLDLDPIAYLLPPLCLPSLSTVAALNWNNQQVQNIPSERSGTKQNQPKTILDFPKFVEN